MAEMFFVACPADWHHSLDRENFVCLECGHEAVEIPQATALTMMAADRIKQQEQEEAKTEHEHPETDQAA